MRVTILAMMLAATAMSATATDLQTDRASFTKLATGWGWSCKPPVAADMGGPTEAVTCRNPANLDTITVYGGTAATRLIAYYGDQTDAGHDEPAVTLGRLTQAAKLLGAESLDKDVRQAVQKQRKYAEEQSCVGVKCPSYDEARKGGGVSIRLWGKPKLAWRWEISAE